MRLGTDRLPGPLRTLVHSLLLSSAPQARFHSSHAAHGAKLDSTIRLRFAPSPTGYLHLGGLRTALFNHLLARRHGGKWLLRIEDTDKTRFVEGAVESLVRTLKWAKLDYDEGPDRGGSKGPYVQSERRHIYDEHVQTLLDVSLARIQSGKAYHCFCSADRLASVRKQMQRMKSNATYDRHCLHLCEAEVQKKIEAGEKSVVRFKSTPREMTQHDLVYDAITYKSTGEEDFVLRKSDGLPTYHFANVVDDHLMGITHVLRGEEWVPSTPKHLDLYEALGWQAPQFAHLPILVNKDGSKLSKRMGDVRVEDYIEKGFEPEALLNFVALMGWSPPTNDVSVREGEEEGEPEVLSPDELVSQFSIDRINRHRATMNLSKLNYLNRQHIVRKLEDTTTRHELVAKARAVLQNASIISDEPDEYIVSVIKTLQDRLYTLNDLPALGSYYFQLPDYDTDSSKQLYASVPSTEYGAILSEALEHGAEDADSLIAKLLNGRKHKNVMSTLRHALTGQKVGAGVKATLETLGSTRSVARLERALVWSRR